MSIERTAEDVERFNDDMVRIAESLNPTPHLNRSKVRQTALDFASVTRAQGFTRVGASFFERIEAKTHAAILDEVRRHPSKGKTLLAAVLAGCLSGCATAPEKIAPAYVSQTTYQSWTCEQLTAEQPRLVAALDHAAGVQRKTRSKDAAGWIFLGWPAGSAAGHSQETEIARLKGELTALQAAAASKGCGLVVVPVVVVTNAVLRPVEGKGAR